MLDLKMSGPLRYYQSMLFYYIAVVITNTWREYICICIRDPIVFCKYTRPPNSGYSFCPPYLNPRMPHFVTNVNKH